MAFVTFAGGLLAIGGAWFLVEQARKNRVRASLLTWVAGACLLLLIVLAWSDWPSMWLNDFWSDHSIVGSIISTVLLVGAGFLGLEAHAIREQERLSDAMAGTAFAGLVNPLIDVDTALLLLVQPQHLPGGWDQPTKPLRWIRDARDCGVHLDGRAVDADWDFGGLGATQASNLIAQCLRRLVGSARDWAALASASMDGRAAIEETGRLRNELTELRALIDPEEQGEVETARALWTSSRAAVQALAVALEHASLTSRVRPELDFMPTEDVCRDAPRVARWIVDLKEDIERRSNGDGDRRGLRTLLRESGALINVRR